MGLMTAGGLLPSSRRRMLLPPEGALFIRRRIEEVIGLALIIGSAMLLLAWLSYAPTDPSPLRAAPGPVKNLFGAVGAAATDVGVQSFGLGYLLFIAVLSIWGWRLFAHRGLNRLAIRVTSVAIAVLTASIAFGALPIATGVDLPTGPGGAIGQLFLGRVLALGPWIGGLGGGTIGIAAAVVAGLATLGAVGFGSDSWRQNLKALARQPEPEPARIAWRGATERRLVERPVERAVERPAPEPSLPHRAEPSLTAAPRATAEPSLLGAGFDAPAREARRDPVLAAPPAAPRKSGFASLLRKAAPEPAAQRQLSLPLGASTGAAPRGADSPLDLLPGESSHLPPVTLLAMGDATPSAEAAPSEQTLAQGRLLIAALADFGVAAMITTVRSGPLTTSFELEPAPGVKTARVVGLADDIAGVLGVACIRIAGMLATARPMIVVELPNPDRATLTLRPLLSDAGFERTAARLTLALGRDCAGAPLFADLARLPHLLIAGAVGSGRTTLLHSLLLSVLYRLPAEECRLLLISPTVKAPEDEARALSAYAEIPHLLTPVVGDAEDGMRALRWAVREMEQRYRSMAKIGVRNVESYNQRIEELASEAARRMRTVQTGFDPVDGTPVYEELQLDLSPLPLIIVAIDDLGPLMRLAAIEAEAALQRLSQMARAVGIHVIVTSCAADVTPGVKAQFASRICLRTGNKPDSRALIGEAGAEQLLGRGDGLYMSPGGKITRMHGAQITADEIGAIAKFLRSQGAPRYVEGITTEAALNSPKLAPMTAT